MKRLKYGYRGYREVCLEAYEACVSNPTIYWAEEKGFYCTYGMSVGYYLSPGEACIGMVYYDLNTNGRSFSGSHREYSLVRNAVLESVYGIENPDEYPYLIEDYIPSETPTNN